MKEPKRRDKKREDEKDEENKGKKKKMMRLDHGNYVKLRKITRKGTKPVHRG